MEADTGEAELMDELLNLIDEEPIPRLDNDVEIETVLPSTNFRMKFMPAPGVKNIEAHVLSGSTLPASTPPNA
ncbi:hypothetical protein ACET3Z_027873 [Daucus carota]